MCEKAENRAISQWLEKDVRKWPVTIGEESEAGKGLENTSEDMKSELFSLDGLWLKPPLERTFYTTSRYIPMTVQVSTWCWGHWQVFPEDRCKLVTRRCSKDTPLGLVECFCIFRRLRQLLIVPNKTALARQAKSLLDKVLNSSAGSLPWQDTAIDMWIMYSCKLCGSLWIDYD